MMADRYIILYLHRTMTNMQKMVFIPISTKIFTPNSVSYPFLSYVKFNTDVYFHPSAVHDLEMLIKNKNER